MDKRVNLNNLDNLISSIFARVTSIEKWTFTSACIIGLITHIFYISNMFANEDFFVPLAPGLQAGYTFGRWLLGAAVSFFSYGSPAVIGVLTILLLALTTTFIVRILNIQSKTMAVCFAALVMTFPSTAYLSGYLTYLYAYTLSLFLSVGAFLLVEKGRFGWIISGVLLCLSLGIYQSYISVTMTLCLTGLLIVTLKSYENGKQFWKTIRVKLLRYFGMGVLGVGLYLVFLKVIFVAQGYIMEDNYTGITKIGQFTLGEYLVNTGEAYRSFLNFLQGSLFQTSMITQILLYTLFAIAILSFILVSVEEHLPWWQKMIAVIFCVLFPVTINVIDIVAPLIGVTTIGSHSYIMIFALVISMVERCCSSLQYRKKRQLIIKFVLAFVACALIIISFDFYLLSNTYYIKMDATYQRTVAFANRLMMRIEQLPEYHPYQSVVVLGALPRDYAQNKYFAFPEIINDRAFSGQYIGTNDVRRDNYKLVPFINYHLGASLQRATNEQVEKIKNMDLSKKMPNWPAKNSVRIIDNLIVIKLNYTYGLDIEKLSDGQSVISLVERDYLPSNYTYAWYIDAPNGTREYVHWYGPTPYLEYKFKTKGKYSITVFVKNEEGELLGAIPTQVNIE